MAVPYMPQKGDNNWDVALGQSIEWLNAKIDTTATNAQRVTFGSVPANSSAAGVPGTIAHDDTYLYLCVSGNSWMRFAKDVAY